MRRHCSVPSDATDTAARFGKDASSFTGDGSIGDRLFAGDSGFGSAIMVEVESPFPDVVGRG